MIQKAERKGLRKAGVMMSFVNRQFYEKHKKRRLEKLWRRSLAWLLAVCICLGNVNIAAFAAESVETGGTLSLIHI